MTKELSDFDFKSVPQINKKQIIDLSMCEFIDKRNNIVFTGPPGVGKSHLAIALGREACRRGYNVKFFTASELVNTYIESRQEKSILRLEGHIKRSDLVKQSPYHIWYYIWYSKKRQLILHRRNR